METIPKLWIVSSVGGKIWHLPAPIWTSSPLHDERGQNIAQYTVRHPLSRESCDVFFDQPTGAMEHVKNAQQNLLTKGMTQTVLVF